MLEGSHTAVVCSGRGRPTRIAWRATAYTPPQVQTRKSLSELEAELYAARMLLLNTYPSEVCTQLMEMYSKMVMHTTAQSTSVEEAAPSTEPVQPATPAAVHADAATCTDRRSVDDGPSTSTAPHQQPNTADTVVPVSTWRLCFGTNAAEARFARWLTMHSVAGDLTGLLNTLLLSTALLLMFCMTVPAAVDTFLVDQYRPCLAWLVPYALLSSSVHGVVTKCPVWYRAHREAVCAALRVVLMVGGIVHALHCWPAATRVSHAPLLATFLACIVAYPSVQFAVRWQVHVVLQLAQLLVLLVATPFLFHWSNDNGELVVVLLVFICFGFALPCVLLHSAERRLRFLYAEASSRSA